MKQKITVEISEDDLDLLDELSTEVHFGSTENEEPFDEDQVNAFYRVINILRDALNDADTE